MWPRAPLRVSLHMCGRDCASVCVVVRRRVLVGAAGPLCRALRCVFVCVIVCGCARACVCVCVVFVGADVCAVCARARL